MLIITIICSYLLLNPKDSRVIIVESLLSPITCRNSLAEALFKHLNVCTVTRYKEGIYFYETLLGLACCLHAKSSTLYIYHRTPISSSSGYRI